MTAPATLTEKIMARAAGKDRVRAGEIVTVDVDLAMIPPAVIGKLFSDKRFAFGKVHSLASGEELNFWPASLRKENSAFDRSQLTKAKHLT